MTHDTAGARHAERARRNADQVSLTDHLLTQARDRLAGRDAAGEILLDHRPREQVVLGVLTPQPRPVVDLAPAAPSGGAPHEPGVPVDRLPASELGLTALIAPHADQVVLNVRATYALYLQHTPSFEQQAERSGLPSPSDDPSAADDGDAANDTEDQSAAEGRDAVEQLIEHAIEDSHASPRDSTLIAPSPPTSDDLAGLPPELAAAVVAAVAGVQPDAATTLVQPRGPGGRDQLRTVYRRYDITVEHVMPINVPLDARPHTVSERQTYGAAQTTAVGAAQDPPPGTPGGLFVAMAGNSATRIPRQVVLDGPDTYATHLREQRRPEWITPLPQVAFQVSVQRTPDGPLRLALTLVNETPEPDRDRGFTPELSLYDAGFSIEVTQAEIVPSEYRVVERDYRKQPLVWAHGRFCCLDEEAFLRSGRLTTTTLPLYRQHVYESRPELQPTFTDLAISPVATLEPILQHMQHFEAQWEAYLSTNVSLSAIARAACTADQLSFSDEVRRFARGLDLIRTDLAHGGTGIGGAFVRANEAFALMNTEGGLDAPGPPTTASWRLFQIVYVVSNLASLSARETTGEEQAAWRQGRQGHGPDHPTHPSDLDELDVADVLWFPTGGGKSAALYGLVAVGMFFDRLRGKHAGVSSMIRFPLRMLSVQQLERVLRLVVACETVRHCHGDPGDAFRLGYWVGKNNTPNKLTDPVDERWRDLASMSRHDAQWRRDNAVVPTCPFCANSGVELSPDPDAVLLRHRCPSCHKDLPVDISDDEVFRHLPAIVISTVDKIASLAFNAHASHLTHGPTHRCPDHGFVTYPQGREARCLARQHCTRQRREWTPVTIKDPAPALVIQDELHLLSEELGTLAAHYETLWQHLCIVGSGLPSKVLAATATISDYANQVTQLYALNPRRFPTDGWTDGASFYAQRHDDLVRRVFVGALPTQMDTLDVSLAAGEIIRAEVTRLAELDPAEVVNMLGLTATTPEQLADLLFRYELQGYYCNRKTDADRVHASNERQARLHHPGFVSVRLNGQSKLAEISDTIRRVERETLATPADERLAAIAGTSLISHGVDLERLNLLFVLGMPSTVAYYVQASSRAGRTDVGIVFTALGRHHVRDRSVFHFFQPQHEHVEVLVEPVALNRFSTHGPRKTVSGLLAALLMHQWGRDPGQLGPAGNGPQDFTRADELRRLLARMRANAAAGTGPDPVQLAQTAVKAAYGLSAPVLDPHISDRFAADVEQLVTARIGDIEAATESLLSRSLRPRPPTSLRDVDISADFGATSWPARRRFEFLGGSGDMNDELAIAHEGD
jgi:hypothetical protein